MGNHYANLQSLASDIPSRTITSMLDDDKDSVADPDVVEDVLQKVDDEINGYLEGRYSTPLTGDLPAVVKSAARNFLAEALYKRRNLVTPKLSWVLAANASRAKLQEIKDGSAKLDLVTPPARPAGAAIMERSRSSSRY